MPWSDNDDASDAEISQQLALISEFYQQVSTEPAALTAARGLAPDARIALDELLDAYLTPWPIGDVRHKLMVASILSAMAEDHQLAVTALDVAASWARQGGQERAMTAAIALGGPLGQRHLAEAARLLWPLTLSDEQVSRVARLALAQLFAAEMGMTSDRSTIARFLVLKIRPLLMPEATAHERREALAVINAALTAPSPASPGPPQGPPGPPPSQTPALASRLRARPADQQPIAELFAAVLSSVSHRRSAVIALHLTLATLTDDVDCVQLAASLGRAILPRLTHRTREVLELTLPDPQRTEVISPRVISAFLNADREVVGAR